MIQTRVIATVLGLLLAGGLGPVVAQNQQPFDLASLPDLGDASSTVLAPSEQERIGREIMRQIERSGALLNDPDIEEYIQGLGRHIAAHANQENGKFRFFVIRSEAINAFALPGGYIGINAGLILAADTESELAGVVAHEVAHVTQHHIARQIEGMQGSGLATLGAVLGAILIAANTGESDAAMATVMSAQALQMQRQINYTRAHEYEADRIGIGILKDAGFDPEGMASFFEKLQRQSRFSAGASLPEYLRTHPLTRNRITEARNRAEEDNSSSHRASRRFYLTRERINGLLAAEQHKAPVELTPARSPVDSSFADELAQYREAVIHKQQAKYDQAAETFERLRDQSPDIISYHLGHAESLMAMGRTDQALASYESANRLFPNNETLMESHARSLLQADQPERAIRLMQRLVNLPDAKPRHHRLLARAASEAGRSAESRYHMAGYYQQQGDIYNAIAQMRLALEDPEVERDRLDRYVRRLRSLTAEWHDLPPDVQRAQSGREPSR